MVEPSRKPICHSVVGYVLKEENGTLICPFLSLILPLFFSPSLLSHSLLSSSLSLLPLPLFLLFCFLAHRVHKLSHVFCYSNRKLASTACHEFVSLTRNAKHYYCHLNEMRTWLQGMVEEKDLIVDMRENTRLWEERDGESKGRDRNKREGNKWTKRAKRPREHVSEMAGLYRKEAEGREGKFLGWRCLG